MVRTRSLTAAASPARLRSGLAAAITRWPSATSGSITRSQLADSAKAPWTRTMVGLTEVLWGRGGTSVTVALVALRSPPYEALVRPEARDPRRRGTARTSHRTKPTPARVPRPVRPRGLMGGDPLGAGAGSSPGATPVRRLGIAPDAKRARTRDRGARPNTQRGGGDAHAQSHTHHDRNGSPVVAEAVEVDDERLDLRPRASSGGPAPRRARHRPRLGPRAQRHVHGRPRGRPSGGPRGLRRSRGHRDRDAAWRAVRPAGRLSYASRPAHTVTFSAGKPTFVATSHAAWSSLSVRTSRTTMTAPSRSIVHPDCFAAASSAARCSPGSKPSGNVTSTSSAPGGWSPCATGQA